MMPDHTCDPGPVGCSILALSLRSSCGANKTTRELMILAGDCMFWGVLLLLRALVILRFTSPAGFDRRPCQPRAEQEHRGRFGDRFSCRSAV